MSAHEVRVSRQTFRSEGNFRRRLKAHSAGAGQYLPHGHPWVKELYRPHITLGFGPDLDRVLRLSTAREEWELEVSSVEFAKIGFPGLVEGLIDLGNHSL